MNSVAASPIDRLPDRHPKGLYVLFASEMWERFSFYTMLSMFTLYLQDHEQGFGWARERATELYANYKACVYLSPLVGGWIADRFLGYRRSAMFGALFFVAGHLLLAAHSVGVMYAALACLVVGNGFFKPNITAMVGDLYPDESPLKDRAYSIFYMGINIGACLAPIVAEIVSNRFGFHPAFAVASGGMLLSAAILWKFKRAIEPSPELSRGARGTPREKSSAGTANAPSALDLIPDWKRISALLVVFLIVIVFYMAFDQNGTTMLYFANDNTAWSVSGILSNAINPFWIIALTFPMLALWRYLNRRGAEPSTPAKMTLGMMFTAAAFFVMALAGKAGGDHGRVSPAWLIGAYFVLSIGELMLSPMGLSLVSKVAPKRVRSLMIGAWFVATAIGDKLTQVGVLWDEWLHSSFFAMLAALALATGVLLFFLLKPLKRAMPGV